MHLAPLIRDLAIILGVAGVVTLVFKKIKQPVVLGYLVAGMIVGPHTPPLPLVSDLPNIKIWAELGVIFLMFSLGLEFTFHKLTRVGTAAVGTALFEVLGMVGIGYLVGKGFGWSFTDSIFLGGIIAISSTTIIIKAFETLNLRTRRFSELVLGVLIVEDLCAILLLVALSTMAASHTIIGTELLFSVLKLILLVGAWFLIGYFFIPSFLKYAGKWVDDETLTIIAIGLCLLLVVLANRFHYSPALGAFIMGSILAETHEARRIESLIRPLKDLFAAIFFVSVGMLIDPHAIITHWHTISIITLCLIFGKITLSTLGALLTGQTLRRSIRIGFSLAQIGEFSFMIATLGITLNATHDFLYPIAVSVSVLTTFMTPFLIQFSEKFSLEIEKKLPSTLQDMLFNYSKWLQRPSQDPELTIRLRKSSLRFALNAILVTAIIQAMAHYGAPILGRYFSDPLIMRIAAWTSAMLLGAPFVWGMFFAFRPHHNLQHFSGHHFIGQLSAVILLGVMSLQFFPTGVSFIITLGSAAFLFAFFYRRLEGSYHWFETHFLSNIGKQNTAQNPQHFNSMLPWDLHLVRIVVNSDSAMAGLTLKEANIREQFGLNIVVISRGSRTLVSPTASDRLLPGDELLVLGSEDENHIDKFNSALSEPADRSRDLQDLNDYVLKRHLISLSSPWIGKTILDSGIRAKLKGLVVGLQRGELRTINPPPHLVLEAGDLLWIVGEAKDK